MPRPPGIPAYRRKGTQAVVTLRDPTGRRRDVRLGPYGTAASKREYARVVAEWEERQRQLPGASAGDLTVAELILYFWRHVEAHYRHPDGTPTSEVENYRYSLRPVRELYGHTPAAQFGPLALKAVRRKMVEDGLARGVINQRVGRIRGMFKWAVGEQLVGPSAYHALQAVEGLKAGRSDARERPRVVPVADDVVEATLPHLNRHVAGMVRAQRLTGMRPGEVCSMRRSEIDMSGAVWMYRPARHKTSWRGKGRVIGIGPKAQAVLREFFTPAIDDYLFSPARARSERFAALREKRVSPVQPSQRCRKKARPKRRPGERFTRISYANAVRKACEKAGVGKWAPNQLRHTFATEVRKRFGLEAAQVGLGHAKADVTQVYAEADGDLVQEIAAAVG
ncbi:MAG: site-specific integrase [Zavarzinella sp.]|nr:site-specific integrase [Zavarzinella sp.]